MQDTFLSGPLWGTDIKKVINLCGKTSKTVLITRWWHYKDIIFACQ
jgi:hypothetical protein